MYQRKVRLSANRYKYELSEHPFGYDQVICKNGHYYELISTDEVNICPWCNTLLVKFNSVITIEQHMKLTCVNDCVEVYKKGIIQEVVINKFTNSTNLVQQQGLQHFMIDPGRYKLYV